jgi:hypothetical protein
LPGFLRAWPASRPHPPLLHVATDRTRLRPRPAAQQVVVGAGQLQQRRVVRHIGSQLLDGVVHLEQQRPLAVLAHQALGPEERGIALPRVTGLTLCRLVPGYSTMSPAASLTCCTP